MLNVCFYFQVHQPYRLAQYSVFDIGSGKYFDDKKNQEILRKVAHKCYLPTNTLLLQLLKQHPEFKISFSFSGIFLEQCQEYCPEVLASFQKLVNTGQVEILAETYHHSLAFLYNLAEFSQQVRLHEQTIQKLFSKKPTIFRNTELIYTNELAQVVEDMGYEGVLLEGWEPLLQGKSPNFIYTPPEGNVSLLLKNYQLADDIAFRFSNQGWCEHPLMVTKFAQWIHALHGNADVVNLFMDYETFGEHQWESTGIFSFLKALPAELLKHPDTKFSWPSTCAQLPKRGVVDVQKPLSWADSERDVSAWMGNDMQQSALQKLYALKSQIDVLNNPEVTAVWRKLQTSDHFYYMCTKWFNDGDVHKYFSPYESPYDAFIYFMNVLRDLQLKMGGEDGTTKKSNHACDSRKSWTHS